MANTLEALMILCFGISWPISIHKSWTSRTNKGKSLLFELFVWIGYIFGIARKFYMYAAAGSAGLDFMFYLGWAFYVMNWLEISADMLIYVRNHFLDKKRDAEAAKA